MPAALVWESSVGSYASVGRRVCGHIMIVGFAVYLSFLISFICPYTVGSQPVASASLCECHYTNSYKIDLRPLDVTTMRGPMYGE